MSIGDRGDTLIALSTSGKSKNILKVLKLAKRMKIKTILLSSNSLKGKKKNFRHCFKSTNIKN